jgi:phosphocarrier protein
VKFLQKQIQVTNNLGLHARPATVIVKLLQNCKSDVSFTYENETVNPKSIMNILMLAASKNSIITIKISGEDAEEYMSKLTSAFETNFGESS